MTQYAGLRVLRGPDWDQGDTDGGEGYLGTVTQLLGGNHTVRVHWDMGQDSTGRAGHDGKCDVRVFDTAQVGIRHLASSCAECGETDIVGMLWRCQTCSGCDLCTLCYNDDKHDLRHQFMRIDASGDKGHSLPKRKISVKVRAIGMFPGAKVVRGKDWEWGDQDGGQGSEGEVKGYDNVSAESLRGHVKVEWPNGVVKSYRLGFHGNVDLTCVEEEVGPFFYRDHLPLLDTRESSVTLGEGGPSVPQSDLTIVNTSDPPPGENADVLDKAADTVKIPSNTATGAVGRITETTCALDVHQKPEELPGNTETTPVLDVPPKTEVLPERTETTHVLDVPQKPEELPGNTETTPVLDVPQKPEELPGNTETTPVLDVPQKPEELPERTETTHVLDVPPKTEELSERTETTHVLDVPPKTEELSGRTETTHVLDVPPKTEEFSGRTETTHVLDVPPKTEEFSGRIETEFTANIPDETEELCVTVSVGDRVAIRVGDKELKELQRECGGCTDRMIKCIGKTGEVTSVSSHGVVFVKFGSASKVSYRFNPQVLIKVAGEWSVGDKVRIRGDGPLVRLLNTRAGWKPGMDRTLNKVGSVTKVDDDGDLHVDFYGRQYIYSPACCRPASGCDVNTLSDVIKGDDIQSEISNLADQSDDPSQNLKLFNAVRNMLANDNSPTSGSHLHYDSDRALFGAISVGAFADVRRMCERDRSKLETEVDNMTPLVYAALRGQRQCIVTLLEMGADVNRHASSDRRRTPVSAAIEGKDPSVLEVLLHQGADTRYLYTNGHTAVHHSVIKNQPVALTLLAMYGADMNATDALGDSPLHMAIERKEHEAMEVLVNTKQVDMYVCNQHGFNAIHLSCLVGNPTALAKLLSRDKSGVDLVRKESTALHMAATSDHVDCVRLLVIEGGAEVNKKDLGKGLTALHAACLGGSLQAAEALLELGAEVNVRTTNGDTPLHFVVGGKIENYGKSEKAEVELACRVQIANMLISNGAFVDAQNEAGKHPFMFGHTRVREGVRAFMTSNKDIVKWQNKELAKFTLGSTQPASASSFCSASSYSSSRGDKEEGPLGEALKGVGLPCGVCGAPKSDVTLQPCQHKCVCSTCSVKVTVCPLCDEEVKDKVFTGQDGETIDPEACKQM